MAVAVAVGVVWGGGGVEAWWRGERGPRAGARVQSSERASVPPTARQSSDGAAGSFAWIRSITVESVSVVTSPS